MRVRVRRREGNLPRHEVPMMTVFLSRFSTANPSMESRCEAASAEEGERSLYKKKSAVPVLCASDTATVRPAPVTDKGRQSLYGE